MHKSKSHTLRQAGALAFVLTGVLPLLMFAYTLVRLNGLVELQDRIFLGLALGGSLLGFQILRRMTTCVADLLLVVRTVTEKPEVSARSENMDLRVPGIGTIDEFREVAAAIDHGRALSPPALAVTQRWRS